MGDLFRDVEWSDYTELLTYGNPPIWAQLLILIGLAFAYYLYRTITRKRAMSKGNRLIIKLLFIVAFFLILFQEQYDLRGMLDTIGL
ncbi:MAG TPA: hypothetical protein ENJ55_03005 [Rhizobiales bacterium]|nr:hypothetical protein [Hyphomicrobiales bacterium]